MAFEDEGPRGTEEDRDKGEKTGDKGGRDRGTRKVGQNEQKPSAGTPPGKFCKITPKNTHFCSFWKQVLDNTAFTFFIFRV